MIIEHSSGCSTNTDKLADVPAEILEAAANLWNLCEKYRRPCFVLVDPYPERCQTGYSFYYLDNGSTPERPDRTTPEMKQQWWGMVEDHIERLSGGRVKLNSEL